MYIYEKQSYFCHCYRRDVSTWFRRYYSGICDAGDVLSIFKYSGMGEWYNIFIGDIDASFHSQFKRKYRGDRREYFG